MLEIPGMRKMWCTIVGLKIQEVMCQGNRSHSPTTARNSILPEVSLEAESGSEPLDKSLAGWIMTLALGGPEQRAHWSSSVPGLLTPCQVLGACYLKPLGVLTCYSRNRKQIQLESIYFAPPPCPSPCLALLDQWSSSLGLLSTPLCLIFCEVFPLQPESFLWTETWPGDSWPTPAHSHSFQDFLKWIPSQWLPDKQHDTLCVAY